MPPCKLTKKITSKALIAVHTLLGLEIKSEYIKLLRAFFTAAQISCNCTPLYDLLDLVAAGHSIKKGPVVTCLKALWKALQLLYIMF